MSALDALAGFTFLRLLLGGEQGGGALQQLPYVPPSGPMGTPSPILRPGDTPLVTPAIAPGWPQALPADLPPFPGPGWEPDTPVPTPVVQRAVALLGQLWQQGEGTHVTEMTAGHWVTYLAQVLNGKHGVTAWRISRKLPRIPPPGDIGPPRRPFTPPLAPSVPSASEPSFVQPALFVQPAAAPAPAASPDTMHALAMQLRDDLNAKGYRKSSQPLYKAWEAANGLSQNGYPGTNDMTALKRALDDLGLPMPNVPVYPWKASGGWRHPNAPTLAEWNR